MSESQQRTAEDVDPRLTTFDFETDVTEWPEDEIQRLLDVLAEQEHMAISEPLQRVRGGQS